VVLKLSHAATYPGSRRFASVIIGLAPPGWRRRVKEIQVKRFAFFAVVLAAGAAACAQSAPQEKPAEERQTAYVRRVSIGATGSLPAIMLLRGGEVETSTVSPPLSTKFETNPTEHYTGGGGALQFALFEQWTVNLNFIKRTAEYYSARTFLSGVDNPKTIRDERLSSGVTETTKARYFDFPLLIRRYNIGRHEYGHRWFVQGGPSLRYVSKIRTNSEITDTSGKKTTDTTPAPHKKSIVGITAGLGGQLIDPVGVRIIPEVRFTRWFGKTFNSPPTVSRCNQLEFLITIGF